MKDENAISKIIVDAAIEVHRVLGGPGLLESVYEEALVYELGKRELAVQQQVALPVRYKGQVLGAPLRIDLLVAELVIVECKATSQYAKIYESQLLTYLRVSGLRLGLVVDFGEVLLKNGVHRVVNGL
ncbi:MAG: GxxExxY protein [Thermodesulfobacteriota bacterium]|jgi:GxxExxY protein